MVDETQSSASADAGQAGAGTSTEQYSNAGRTTVNDADIGGTERIRMENIDRSGLNFLNAKNDFDNHKSVDHAALLYGQKQQAILDSQLNRAAEQTLKHQADLNANILLSQEASRRHYEDNHTVRIMALGGFTNDAVTEALANQIATAVTEALKPTP